MVFLDYTNKTFRNSYKYQPELRRVRKILLYAPGTPHGLERMEVILAELGLKTASRHEDSESHENFCAWNLLPISKTDLRSSDLGAKLGDALARVRVLEASRIDSETNRHRKHGVVFLAMDAPILPLDDIVSGLRCSSMTTAGIETKKKIEKETPPLATLCPAEDGGYAMLCVPPNADPSRTFLSASSAAASSCMYWSHPWTGMSQLKALTDQNIGIRIGKIVQDIDEASDVEALCRYLKVRFLPPSEGGEHEDENDSIDDLTKNLNWPGGWSPSAASVTTDAADGVCEDAAGSLKQSLVTSSHPTCHFTRRALQEAMGGGS